MKMVSDRTIKNYRYKRLKISSSVHNGLSDLIKKKPSGWIWNVYIPISYKYEMLAYQW